MELLKSKKSIIIILVSCIVFTLILTFGYIYLSDFYPKSKIIVINNSINHDVTNEGISIIDLSNHKLDTISTLNKYDYIDYCRKRNSIYAVRKDKNRKIAQIFEINLINKKTTLLDIRLSNSAVRNFNNIKCVPNKNAVSYSDKGGIYIYDLDSKNESVVIGGEGEHSWNSNGTKILYCSTRDYMIHEFEVNKRIDKNLNINGYEPQYSIDEKYITYKRNEGNESFPCVSQLSTEREWVYKKAGIQCSFFKDTSKILIREFNNSTVNPRNQQLVLWDFRNNKSIKLPILYNDYGSFVLID